ncbi:unnamed protein product, partial [Medioppia subpectinata]
RKRPTLRLIIASATIDCELMRQYFDHNPNPADTKTSTATVLCLDGRCHPVDVFYCERPVADYVRESVATVIKIHERYASVSGDILVFLTGQEEVESAVGILLDYARGLRERNDQSLKRLFVLPMYAALPATDQMRVFERFGRNTRKVVVATNIAETSLTIPGVVHVIDTGFVKMRHYNSRAGTDSLVIVPTSQAASQQRAGRAGRERAGNAYRLYTEEAFAELPPFTVPEIQRSCLALPVLQLKALGVSNLARFEFLSPPPDLHVIAALVVMWGQFCQPF